MGLLEAAEMGLRQMWVCWRLQRCIGLLVVAEVLAGGGRGGLAGGGRGGLAGGGRGGLAGWLIDLKLRPGRKQ